MKLSIGMIVKNESKHLKNCLTALQSLLSAIKSELIIADTGSTDDTVQIAKAFTDHVMEIPWNDDFAEARNHTLRAAKGEWFMFIDADEYLHDAKEIIKFFKQGTCNHYIAAGYYVRNYAEDGRYTQSAAYRLRKITPETKFTGRIHETLPANGTMYLINTYVHHYGYVQDEETEFGKKKTERNLPILIKEVQDNPNNLIVIRALAYDYKWMKAYDEAKKYICKGLEIIDGNAKHGDFSSFYILHAKLYNQIGTIDAHHKVIEIANEYFTLKQQLSIGAVDMYIAKAESHFVLGEYQDTVISLIKAYETIQLYKAGRLDISEIGTLILNNVNDDSANMIMSNIARCYMRMNDYENALKHIVKLEQKDELLIVFDEIIRGHKSVAKIIQPFFDLYQQAIYDYLMRHNLKEHLPSLHQVVYHAQMADICKKQGDNTAAINHIKTAMRADSRFVPILSTKLPSKG
ncbi:MAG: glycosyltransferase [Defluviitaleaceae bacterium]|nr:glycosyltransferase [Defluviitaleaceae bacterium]